MCKDNSKCETLYTAEGDGQYTEKSTREGKVVLALRWASKGVLKKTNISAKEGRKKAEQQGEECWG